MEVSLHIPASRVAWLAEALRPALEAGCRMRIRKPLPVLHLSGMRCLLLQLEGSGEHVRCPFIPPLLNTRAFCFARQEKAPHLLEGVDWLLYGSAELLDELAAEMLQVASENGGGPVTFSVTPFLALQGPLDQAPREGDVPFSLAKSPANLNQLDWHKKHRQLMELPEERWGEAGISNTGDLIRLFEPFLDRLLPEEPKLVLDLGCGLGQLARSMAQRFPQARVIGLDASAEAIAVAAKEHRLPNLSFKAADFSAPLGFEPGSVDLVISANALPYAQDQRGMAASLMRLLTPDGLLLNYCRAEESHLLWDFPLSLAVQTNTQIYLADWIAAAKDSGRATEVWGVPMGMTSVYYRASSTPIFKRLVDGYAYAHHHSPPGPYMPWNSHALLAHSALARHADEAALPLKENHFARLEQVLYAIPAAPKQYQDGLVASWFYIAKRLELFPELLDFCLAVLPAAEPALRAMLAPALAQNRVSA